MRALVIGGSLGGLLAAHLLRSTGWDATVFERNEEELAGRGVGLGTHPQLIAILKRAGVAFDETMGIEAAKGRLPRSQRQDAVRAADCAHLERLVAALPARCAMRCRRKITGSAKDLFASNRTAAASPRCSPTA